MSSGDGPYDPALRRDTPLALRLKAAIARDGPISVCAYMRACLADEQFGYYRTQQAIGKAGDFVTAPEISQAFGEILGLWSCVVWQSMGSPQRFNLVELGPGRGTLMRDGLRAARLVPGFIEAADVHLVECNPVLVALQRKTLSDCGAQLSWHEGLADLPTAPTILIGNEFLDTIPASQSVACAQGMRERCVGLDEDGELAFVTGELCERSTLAEMHALGCERTAVAEDPAEGITECQSFSELARDLLRLTKTGALAAAFIDYGHTEHSFGDTLQAVRNHSYEHPLTSPGEADLTVQVDFASFAAQIAGTSDIPQVGSGGADSGRALIVDGPVTQGEFLGQLGIVQRASRLMSANPARAGEIEAGILRLMAPNGMGTRFKVIGVRTTDVPELPGFSKHHGPAAKGRAR